MHPPDGSGTSAFPFAGPPQEGAKKPLRGTAQDKAKRKKNQTKNLTETGTESTQRKKDIQHQLQPLFRLKVPPSTEWNEWSASVTEGEVTRGTFPHPTALFSNQEMCVSRFSFASPSAWHRFLYDSLCPLKHPFPLLCSCLSPACSYLISSPTFQPEQGHRGRESLEGSEMGKTNIWP
jgi:hypothetical protein